MPSTWLSAARLVDKRTVAGFQDDISRPGYLYEEAMFLVHLTGFVHLLQQRVYGGTNQFRYRLRDGQALQGVVGYKLLVDRVSKLKYQLRAGQNADGGWGLLRKTEQLLPLSFAYLPG